MHGWDGVLLKTESKLGVAQEHLSWIGGRKSGSTGVVEGVIASLSKAWRELVWRGKFSKGVRRS